MDGEQSFYMRRYIGSDAPGAGLSLDVADVNTAIQTSGA